MNLKNEFQPIRDWAKQKGIYNKGDVKTQALKLIEEVGELSKAILNEDEEELIDAIGDCVVVLTSLAELGTVYFNPINCKNYPAEPCVIPCEECNDTCSIEYCINSAYKVISKRKGQMKNGTFIKDK